MEDIARADQIMTQSMPPSTAAASPSDKAIFASRLIDMTGIVPHADRRRGRGASVNPSGRYERQQRVEIDDGWELDGELPPFKTMVQEEHAKSIITRNTSPDIPFDRSINPYRGCEHGCSYCYARPTHAFMGLGPGLDFESKLFVKSNAARQLQKELSRPNYKVAPIAMGTNTDPYQPVEKTYQVTRQVLEVLDACNHPVTITTKSALILRDLDILQSMAERNLVEVCISVTTLDRKLSRALEPRASSPNLRLQAIKKLTDAGVPCSVQAAPLIPALNDHELERILDCGEAAGAYQAAYIVLRLPMEVSPVFKDWLLRHVPDRYRHVMNLVRSMSDGKDYDAQFGKRMKGDGPYAWQLKRRFELQIKKLGLTVKTTALDCNLFRSPQVGGVQLTLF